jgi:hypothetical protein
VTKERRRSRRIAPPTPLEAKVQASFPVRVLDVSQGGAQIEVERSLRPNVSCDLRFPSPEGEFWVRGTVRRCRVWGFGVNARDQKILLYRAGVEFDEPSPGLLERLRLAVPELPEAPAVTEAAVQKANGREAEGEGATHEVEPGEAAREHRGPVKIRISSAHVRKILSALDEK